MRTRRRRETPRSYGIAGFSLIEALVSVALMSAIVGSLAAVTGQWLPNWHRGFGRVQRVESLDIGLLRLISDLEAAQFITANNASDAPVFLGDAKSVTLVRVASAPGAAQRLEFVRFTETIDERGFVMVRSHAPFRPLAEGRSLESQIYFVDPVVLVRAPFRVSFEFAGPDRLWRSSWQNEALLPSVARIDVRDARTGDVLPFSTAALLHVDFPGQAVLPSRSTTLGQ